MTRNNIMLKRLGAAAFSALLVWSMPGTSAFAEGVAEIAVQAQAQASQQADTAENAAESSFTADEQTGAEGAEASADEASSEAAPSADESLAAAADIDDEDADAQQARGARVAKAGETDSRFLELDRLVKEHNGLWCPEAEEYLLRNF